SRSNGDRPGSRNACHSALTPFISSTGAPVVVPPRGRISAAVVNGQLNVNCRTSSSAQAAAPMRLAASATQRSARLLSSIGILRSLEPRVLRPTEASRERQLHREIERVQAESQPEQVHLEPFLDADQDAEHAEHAELA